MSNQAESSISKSISIIISQSVGTFDENEYLEANWNNQAGGSEEEDFTNISSTSDTLAINAANSQGTTETDGQTTGGSYRIDDTFSNSLMKTSFLKFTEEGFSIGIRTLTDEQRHLFAEKLAKKYEINITAIQIHNIKPTFFQCYLNFLHNNKNITIVGYADNLNMNPITISFEAFKEQRERQLLEIKVKKYGKQLNLKFTCEIGMDKRIKGAEGSFLSFVLPTLNEETYLLDKASELARLDMEAKALKSSVDNRLAELEKRFSVSLNQQRIELQNSYSIGINTLNQSLKNYNPINFFNGVILTVGRESIMRSFNKDGKGFDIYAGWYICDGRNGAPDLRGKFLVGLDIQDIDYNTIGKTGGSSKVKLNVNQLPSHNHQDIGHTHYAELKTSSDGQHSHLHVDSTYGCCQEGGEHSGSTYEGFDKTTWKNTEPAGAHTHTVSGSVERSYSDISFTGSNEDHENRPPYYVVAYIIYFG